MPSVNPATLDSDLRIVCKPAAFIARMVEVGTFVCKLCLIRKYQEAVGKPLRNIELFLFSAEITTPNHFPYVREPVRRSTATSKTSTADCSDQLALREIPSGNEAP